MKINIRAVHFELDSETRDYAAEKIGKLDDYYKNIIQADVAIENHESEAKFGYHYIVKTTLHVPGKNVFAEATGPDQFAAIDNAEEKLKVQIEKIKGKENRGKIDKFQSVIRRFLGKE